MEMRSVFLFVDAQNATPSGYAIAQIDGPYRVSLLDWSFFQYVMDFIRDQ